MIIMGERESKELLTLCPRLSFSLFLPFLSISDRSLMFHLSHSLDFAREISRRVAEQVYPHKPWLAGITRVYFKHLGVIVKNIVSVFPAAFEICFVPVSLRHLSAALTRIFSKHVFHGSPVRKTRKRDEGVSIAVPSCRVPASSSSSS